MNIASNGKEQTASAGWSDSEMAQRIAGGDADAFEVLMRRHNQAMYRTARSILHDDAEAEDAVQDAYLLAYRRIDQFRGDARLSTWLIRIVVNEAIARSRKTSRRENVIRLDNDAEWSSAAADTPMPVSTFEAPEHSAMRKQARALLEAKIDQLPPPFRAVFVLRALEEMSVEEVALCLDLPLATVRTRFFRARGLLREALSRELDFAFEEAFSFDGERCDRIVANVMARLRQPEPGDA